MNPGPAESGIPLLRITNALVARWRVVASCTILGSILGTALALLLPQEYTATVLFVPEGSGQTQLPGGLTGIASQFGVPLFHEPSQSPQFYVSVAKSREFLDRILLSLFPLDDSAPPGDSVMLLTLLGIGGGSRSEDLYGGRKHLATRLSTRVDDETNIVTLMVRLRNPRLAANVANAFVDQLNTFNALSRQSRARRNREFVEQRLDDERESLSESEEALTQFLVQNRNWEQSPVLTMEHSRLERQLQLRQETYLMLRREYESARIEEVNDTPVITIIERAAPPPHRSHPRRRMLVVVATLLAGLIGSTWALSSEYLSRLHDSDDPEVLRSRQLMARVRHEFLHWPKRRSAQPS